MAEARRRDEWERLSYLRSDVHALMGSDVSPDQINPYKVAFAKKSQLTLTDPRDLAAMWGVQ